MSLLQQQLSTAVFAVPGLKFSKLGSKWNKYVSVEVSTKCGSKYSILASFVYTAALNRNKH